MDGRVSASNNPSVQLWGAQSCRALGGSLNGHTDLVNSVAFSADGKHIVSASNDKTVRIWDAQTGLHSTATQAMSSRWHSHRMASKLCRDLDLATTQSVAAGTQVSWLGIARLLTSISNNTVILQVHHPISLSMGKSKTAGRSILAPHDHIYCFGSPANIAPDFNCNISTKFVIGVQPINVSYDMVQSGRSVIGREW
ncbi:hypothetical protein B0H13DRAFT_2334652 [Mycena leptocephala]|nr:hypothetical protein B0H13DRAFT_2334652 [Mycena leptocephala]